MKGARGWLKPFWQLLLMRLRSFAREPSATFWVFGFPLLMSVVLGLAFRNQAGTRLSVAVTDGPERAAVVAALRASEGLSPTEMTLDEAHQALRRGKIALAVVPVTTPRLLLDPTQPDARSAKLLVVDALQRAAGRTDPRPLDEERVTLPGTRYIDFLVPGLLGALTFGGLSALVASRAQNSETASGLMNLVTLPMTVVSGVFFSASHFPGWAQPVLKALPLTALIDGLRAISIDGAGVAALLGPALVLVVWGVGSFALALRLFRWT